MAGATFDDSSGFCPIHLGEFSQHDFGHVEAFGGIPLVTVWDNPNCLRRIRGSAIRPIKLERH